VENSNEEASFGEENWAVISGDTLGDAGEQRAKAELEGGNLAGLDVMVSCDGFGPVVMTTLGSWMAWRLLAWRSLAAQGAVFGSMEALGLMMGACGLMGALGLMMGALSLISMGAVDLMGDANCWRWPGGLMGAVFGSMGAIAGSMKANVGSMGTIVGTMRANMGLMGAIISLIMRAIINLMGAIVGSMETVVGSMGAVIGSKGAVVGSMMSAVVGSTGAVIGTMMRAIVGLMRANVCSLEPLWAQ